MSSDRTPDAPAPRGWGLGARVAALFVIAFFATFAALVVGARAMTAEALTAVADRVLDGELAELEAHVARPARVAAPADDDDRPPLVAAEDSLRAIDRYIHEEAEDEAAFGLSYRVLRADGRVVAAAPEASWNGVKPIDAEPRRHIELRAESPARCMRAVAVTRDVAGVGPLRLEVAYDMEPAEAQLAALTRRFFLALPIALALAGGAGYLLARRALAPLRTIESVAGRMSAWAAGERLPRTGRGDEVDRLAASLNGMLDRLEAAIEANARLTADAAHELRTPLQAISAEVELARRDPAALDRVAAQVARLSALVRDLLTLARADHALTAPRERVALGPLVSELVEDLAPLGAERGVLLSARDLPDADVWGDRGSLRRLFANLLENACLYADPGAVRIEAAQGSAGVTVTIEDSGPGLSADERAHVFSRFWRGERGRTLNPAGCGIGLSICVAIARAHGGAIDVATAANGRGTAFRVRLEPAGSSPSALQENASIVTRM